MDIFSQIWEWLGSLLTNTINWLVDLLPDSPFQSIEMSVFDSYLGYINYFVPIDFMISTFLLWLSSISVYYIYSVILRWIKAID